MSKRLATLALLLLLLRCCPPVFCVEGLLEDVRAHADFFPPCNNRWRSQGYPREVGSGGGHGEQTREGAGVIDLGSFDKMVEICKNPNKTLIIGPLRQND